jgi:hypothetical protein
MGNEHDDRDQLAEATENLHALEESTGSLRPDEDAADCGDDDEAILARYAAELPPLPGDLGVCPNCMARSALEDMRGALRAVLLPWLDLQDDPPATRRLRTDLEARLDEIEDMISFASHGTEGDALP